MSAASRGPGVRESPQARESRLRGAAAAAREGLAAAERELELARLGLEEECGRLLLGERDEQAVAEAEHRLARAERDARRMTAGLGYLAERIPAAPWARSGIR